MKFFRNIVSIVNTVFRIFLMPVIILNTVGQILSGIWLALLSHWSPIVHGIILMIVSSLLLGFIILPGILLIAPIASFLEKRSRPLFIFVTSLSPLYSLSILTLWCLWILNTYTRSADGISLIPLLIWSYGVAMSPWIFLAKKDQEGGGNEFSLIFVFFAEISYVISMIMFLLGTSFTSIALTFGVIMFIAWISIISIVSLLDDQSLHSIDM